MSLQCRKCGAHVPAWASFCNKCGAPIPAEKIPDIMVCPNCRKIQSDPGSRFCDRCGVMVTTPVQPLPPAPPLIQTKTCPRCGFRNSGPSIFFCKKCGSSLERDGPRSIATEQRRPQNAAPITTGGGDAPPRGPGKSATRAPSVPGQNQEAPAKRIRSYSKVAIGIVALLLVLAAVAGVFFLTKHADTSAGNQDQESGPGLSGLIPSGNILGATAENANAPSQPTTNPQKKTARAGLVSNQAVPIVTDTPLKMK
jgi:hypothetical protein